MLHFRHIPANMFNFDTCGFQSTSFFAPFETSMQGSIMLLNLLVHVECELIFESGVCLARLANIYSNDVMGLQHYIIAWT